MGDKIPEAPLEGAVGKFLFPASMLHFPPQFLSRVPIAATHVWIPAELFREVWREREREREREERRVRGDEGGGGEGQWGDERR